MVCPLFPLISYLLSALKEEGLMNNAIHLLDVVALTAGIPEYGLDRGQVGTVGDILAGGRAFEIEFCDREGRTYESVGLRPDQLMVLHFEPASPPPEPVMEMA